MKLITAVLAFVAIALAMISLVGIGVLRSNLLTNADNNLAAVTGQVYRSLHVGDINLTLPPNPVVGESVTWVPDHGSQKPLVIPISAAGYGRGVFGTQVPGPVIPADPGSLPSNPRNAITVGSTSGNGRWRVVGLAASATTSNGSNVPGVVVVATDATSVYRTIGSLTAIDLVVSLVIILALAAVGTAVVRASLRPLIDIEKTAGAIARGDLSRRVPERDPRTEVGRLGRSLNVMLSQIEAAFRARSQSEAAARRSEEKMRQFVADASHELRTPLTAIRGFAEYYRQRGGIKAAPTAEAADVRGAEPADESVPETVSAPGNGTAPEERPEDTGASRNGTGQLASADLDRIMRRVEQESSRMGVLVEDMLLLARLDQQRPLERRPVDLLTLAADAVHDARVVAPTRNINLTVGSGAALLVIGDEVRLRQVIGNLMSNALSHTPDGTPIDVLIRSGDLGEAPTASADASVDRPDQPGRRNPRPAAVLEVADHGPGLTREQAEHVFERFYRADQARTAGGTGLGLAIVAALVAAHNGAAWVRSQPGDGATFCIALPLAPEAAQGADDDEDADAELDCSGSADGSASYTNSSLPG
ncbi:MAG: sensor histidine kinase [Streptosporangiaceae bacterium]